MPTCKRCRQQNAEAGHLVCWNCGAELFDEWRADQAVAEHDAEMLARDGEPEHEPDYDLAEVPF